jgi:hypothetical protein
MQTSYGLGGDEFEIRVRWCSRMSDPAKVCTSLSSLVNETDVSDAREDRDRYRAEALDRSAVAS